MPEFDDTFDEWLTENQGELTEFYLDKPTAGLIYDEYELPYQIASNALLLVKTDAGLTQIGLINFFETYSVNEAVSEELNPLHSGWYHPVIEEDPELGEHVKYIDVVILDKTMPAE